MTTLAMGDNGTFATITNLFAGHTQTESAFGRPKTASQATKCSVAIGPECVYTMHEPLKFWAEVGAWSTMQTSAITIIAGSSLDLACWSCQPLEAKGRQDVTSYRHK